MAYETFDVVQKVRRGLFRSGLSMVVLFAIILVGSCSVTTVDTGKVGVLTLFGRVTGEQLAEGFDDFLPGRRIARGGSPEFGWARLAYHPGSQSSTDLVCAEQMEDQFPMGMSISCGVPPPWYPFFFAP